MKTNNKGFIIELNANEIFVFGSNEAGRHGRGAALDAAKYFGAVYGQGEGLQGKSYGIPTKDKYLNVLSLDEIQEYVNRFKDFVDNNKHLKFYVTAIGTGLANIPVADMKDMFKVFTKVEYDNIVFLPKEFL